MNINFQEPQNENNHYFSNTFSDKSRYTYSVSINVDLYYL